MENQPDYKRQSSLFGLIFGLFSAFLLYFNYKFELESTFIQSIISVIVAVLVVFFPINQYKIDNANILKISDALKIGLITGVIAGLIYAVYTYFHYNQIEPEFITASLEESYKAIEKESGNMTEEQIQQAKDMTKAFVSPFSIATINLISILLKSFVISLVIGLIKKS